MKYYMFESSEKMNISGVSAYVTKLPVIENNTPMLREELHSKLISKIHILNNKAVFIKGVESFPTQFIERYHPLSLLIKEDMEIKYNDQILDVWDEDDAKFQIEMYEVNGIVNVEILKGIFNSIKENLSLALTDPSPYVRHIANYLAEKNYDR